MQLADKVGITYIQIGRYETGKSNASSDVLKKIAIAVNTTTDFLMNGGNAEQLNDKELLNPFAGCHLQWQPFLFCYYFYETKNYLTKQCKVASFLTYRFTIING
ncbi:helix-turn-helix domain-containing protein [Tenacibaculum maritimum]|uniref:helix-turn-helix domain-containing protein n=1 Tax=Tenacibaculum maritimum TaxID=107401 RepID=UPI000C1FBA80